MCVCSIRKTISLPLALKIGKGSAALTGCRSRHIQSNPVLIPWHTRKSEKDRACGRRGKGGEGGEEEAKYGVEEMRWRKREKGRGGERKREGDGGTGGGRRERKGMYHSYHQRVVPRKLQW